MHVVGIWEECFVFRSEKGEYTIGNVHLKPRHRLAERKLVMVIDDDYLSKQIYKEYTSRMWRGCR